MIAGLVLAAGEGSRFGGRKQLAEVDGRPMLERVLAAMAEAPVDRTCVVLGADAQYVRDGVDLHGAEPVVCARWEDGQAASLRAGVEALAGADAVVVVLGDQPFVSSRAVERLLAARGNDYDAVRATYGGVPGHPVVLERTILPRVASLSGDVGARDLLSKVSVVDVPCDGLGRPDDIDTPEQLDNAARAEEGGAPNTNEEAISR